MNGRYTSQQQQQFIDEALRDGFCILRNQVPKDKISKWQTACLPLLSRQMKIEGEKTSRGPNRYYVTFPFAEPFADPDVYADPDILAVVEGLVGRNFVFCQLASDTPVLGSDFQDIHRDCPPLFPELKTETPMFQLAVNFPLVDVTPENGPLDIIRGTHMVSRDEGMRRLERGEVKIEPIFLNAGDVIIRDVRTLHRGTPNRTSQPRPMVVLGYSRSWLHRPEVSIQIPKRAFGTLSEQAKKMMRFNPLVDDIKDEAKPESYTTFEY